MYQSKVNGRGVDIIQEPQAKCQKTMKKRRSENRREEKKQDESMVCSTRDDQGQC